VTRIASLILGGFFIYASWHKIADPPDFSKAIYNYKLNLGSLINLVAIFMPWVELLAGIAVVTGLGRRGGTLGLALLSTVFIAAISYNLYRGHPTICGCFSGYKAGMTMTDAEKFFQMKRELVVNAGLILLAIQILWASCPCSSRESSVAET
ncbi:MAG TPA: MauE/DoxX family redox-associated membrane protein, partial [Planctomycetota bacterium]|nr:MauE/DoxX family redox-associated membrane protein [Planctomycetota bacterium]